MDDLDQVYVHQIHEEIKGRQLNRQVMTHNSFQKVEVLWDGLHSENYTPPMIEICTGDGALSANYLLSINIWTPKNCQHQDAFENNVRNTIANCVVNLLQNMGLRPFKRRPTWHFWRRQET